MHTGIHAFNCATDVRNLKAWMPVCIEPRYPVALNLLEKILETMMKRFLRQYVVRSVAFAAVMLLGLSLQTASGQEPQGTPYMNPQLPPQVRATDLVRRMTLEEKATQMQNSSAAVPRLKILAYQWWSEALHGVI